MPSRSQPNKGRRGRGKPGNGTQDAQTTAYDQSGVESGAEPSAEFKKDNDPQSVEAAHASLNGVADPNGVEHSPPMQLPKAREKKPRNPNAINTPNKDTNRTRATNRNASSQNARAASAQIPIPKDFNPPTSRPPVADIFGVTPERYYAGPSFRNSPAASTLPRPRFLSRSVPNVDQFPGDAGKGSQSTTMASDDSPPSGSVTPEQTNAKGEDSPLNMLFRSDREAKAKASQPRPSILPLKEHSSSSYSLSGLNESPLGSRSARNHSRHNTEGTANGIFPLEMDKELFPNPDQGGAGNKSQENQKTSAQDSTQALKKLLNFSEGQLPGQSVGDYLGTVGPSTPTPKARSQARSSTRLSGGPPLFPNGLDGTTPEQRHAALLALAEKQIHTPAVQRPASSTLRKEVKLSDSPAVSQNEQPPSTPIPSHRTDRQGNPTKSQRAPATTGHISTYPSMHAGNTRPALRSSAKDPAMKSMEDDLRRILKLDALPSDRVSGVQP